MVAPCSGDRERRDGGECPESTRLTVAKYFAFHPSVVDHGPLSAFLEQHGVDAGRRDQMFGDVMNAICRYGHAQESELLKSHLEKFVAAAGKLEVAMPKLGSKEYVHFSSAILSALPPAEPTAANERVRRFSDFALTLAMIRTGAADGLKELSKPHRPQTSKRKFVNELKAAWVRGTGKTPGVSGAEKSKTPVTVFSQFVKIVTDMLPDPSEFETGFADLVRDRRQVAKPPRKT
jgi:hypothetical protein